MSDAFYEQLATGSQVVASILFIAALVYLWRRFVAPAVIASQARKNAELADSEARRDAARAQTEVAQREIDSADADAAAILARARNDARTTRERILAEATADGDRAVRNAEGELERSRNAARERLRNDLLERAMQIARDAASRLDAATDRRLVAETVDIAERGEDG